MMFKLTCYKNNEIYYEFDLSKSKLLIGSAENCDIKIDSEYISPYHCFLFVGTDGVRIIDLESKNGTTINESRDNTYMSSGDELVIADLKFFLTETIQKVTSNKQIEAEDNKISVLNTNQNNDFISQLKPIDDFIIIDGEYCDIVIEEPILFENNNDALDLQRIDFNDIEEKATNINIFKELNQLKLQITHMFHGNIIDIKEIPVNDKPFLFSSNSDQKNIISFYTLESDIEILKVTDKTIEIIGNESLINIKKISNIEYKFSNKKETIFVKLITRNETTKRTPFLGRDKSFHKKSTIEFAAVISFALLLLLFKPEQVKKLEENPVIYKRIVTQTITNSSAGSSSSSPFQRFKQKLKKVVNKITHNKPKKVSKPSFKLKLSTSLSSLDSLDDVKVKVIKSKSRSISSIKIASENDQKVNISKAGVGKVGSGKGKWGNKKFGLRGYGTKDGFDSAYGAPKTVVMGSIDPELLRKIIREHLPQFRRCYQKELDLNSKLKGTISLDFRILKNGSVAKVKIKSKHTTFSSSGYDCMSSVLNMIQFPKPKGGGIVDVRQPLSFHAENNKI